MEEYHVLEVAAAAYEINQLQLLHAAAEEKKSFKIIKFCLACVSAEQLENFFM